MPQAQQQIDAAKRFSTTINVPRIALDNDVLIALGDNLIIALGENVLVSSSAIT